MINGMYLCICNLSSSVKYSGVRAIILVLCFAVFATASYAEAPPVNLQFVRIQEEISVGAVEVIHQDKLGYMWFAGFDGLVQHDGYNYVTYRNKPKDNTSLSSNIIWDIHEDKNGNIWLATDVGLNLFNRDQGSFTHYQNNKDNPNSLINNSTRSIAEDNAGNLWIATIAGLSKFNLAQKSFTNYAAIIDDPTVLSGNQLRSLYVDRAGIYLWIGHYTQGLTRMDLKSGELKHYPFDTANGKGLSHWHVTSIFEDLDGFIWLGTDGGGLNRLDPKTDEFIYFSADPKNPRTLSQNTVMGITSDAEGNLWLATEGGLNFFDRQTQLFTRYSHNPNQKYSLANSNVHSVFFDSNNDLWVGNFPAGVNFLDTSSIVFQTYRHEPDNANALSNNSVLSIDEYPAGIFWLGTDGGGLNRFDMKNQQFTHYKHNPQDASSIGRGAVLSVKHTVEGGLWIGNWQGGLTYFVPGKGAVKHFAYGTTSEFLANDSVWALQTDRQHNLWVGSVGGGVDFLAHGSSQFINHHKQFPAEVDFFVTWKVFEDSKGRIWIGTNDGLGRYVPEQNHFIFYRHDAANPTSLSSDVVLDIEEDKHQRLWIATRGGGLNLLNEGQGTFTPFREKDGLPDEVVRSVKADDQGNLWLGTSVGLVKFNPDTKQFVTYTEKNGLQGNLFNFATAFKASNGDMVFGGTGGFTIFDPAKIKSNEFIPKVAIVDFQIFNKSVVPAVEGSPLTKVISQTDSITLDHHQTVFSFSFVAMSYRNPEKNHFAYMMEGFENNWNYVGGDRRNATYTNLNPGTYTFKVKAANNEGVWNDTGRSVIVHILPPPWKTWWAYMLYGVALFGIVFAFVRAQQKKVLNERNINKQLELKVRERTQELQQKHQLLEEAYLQLEKISLSDPLTGLSNRRYLQKLIPMDVAKVEREFNDRQQNRSTKRSSLDLAFFLLDIDYFKSVNDTHGHAVGDQLLIQFSELLSKICRETDCVVRWGGEEFLIVSRFVSRDESPLMAERIRNSIANHEFNVGDGVVLRKTCSIGFATYPFIPGKPGVLSWEQVIGTADRALYAAKKSGRNRSVGLTASIDANPEALYQRMSENIQQLIDSGELVVIASNDASLNWNAV